MIRMSTLQLLHQWLFCLMDGHVWCMAERNGYFDDARLEIFLQNNKTNAMPSVKKLDGNMLPLCSCVLLQKIKRTQLITRRWLAAIEQIPPPEIRENNGLELDDNGYKILWFEGTTTPNIAVVMDSAEDEGWLKIPLNCSHRFLSFFSFSVNFALSI